MLTNRDHPFNAIIVIVVLVAVVAAASFCIAADGDVAVIAPVSTETLIFGDSTPGSVIWMDSDGLYWITCEDGHSRMIDECPTCEDEGDYAAVLAVQKAIIYCKPTIDPVWSVKLATIILASSEEFSLDPLFVVALCFKESSFNPNAKGITLYDDEGNYAGYCCGLMQLWTGHGIENVYDPAVNMYWGCLKLRKYIDERDGDLRRGLHRYGHSDRGARSTIKLYEKLKALSEDKE